MKRIISFCLLLCCVILVSCKNKEYEELKTKFETLQKDKEAIEVEKNNLQTEYDNLKLNLETLKQEYVNLETKFDDVQKNKQALEQQKSQLSKKLKNSKLLFDWNEMQEKLKSFSIHTSDISTYWKYKKIDKLFETYFEISPCISFELINDGKKRLDSAIVSASFGSNLGTETVIVDNLHPGRSQIINLKAPFFKTTYSLNKKDIPNVEAEIKISINDGKEFSMGFIQIDTNCQN